MVRIVVHCGKCLRQLAVDPLHPRFPRGPFFCPTCAPTEPRREGEPGTPDSDRPVAIDELGEDGASVSVTKKW